MRGSYAGPCEVRDAGGAEQDGKPRGGEGRGESGGRVVGHRPDRRGVALAVEPWQPGACKNRPAHH